MSYRKKDQVFPASITPYFDQEISAAIAQALHDNFSEINSAVKIIGRKTGAHPRAIRNWYEGRNAPNSKHLIILAHHIPAIAETILRLVGRQDIWNSHEMMIKCRSTHDVPPPPESTDRTYTDKFVSINVSISLAVADKLNQRQLWFLGKLQQGTKLKADDIAHTWKVNTRTAWRDTAMLVGLGLIQFVGARRTGSYEIKNGTSLLPPLIHK